MGRNDDWLVSVAGGTYTYVYLNLWPKEVQELARRLRWHKRELRQLRHQRMTHGKHTGRARRAR